MLLDVAFPSQLVGVLFLVTPHHVGFLVLPVPRVDENDVVLSDPDAFLHPAGNPCGSLRSVHTSDFDAVGTQHVRDDGEHLAFIGHSKAFVTSVVAHARRFDGNRFNF